MTERAAKLERARAADFETFAALMKKYDQVCVVRTGEGGRRTWQCSVGPTSEWRSRTYFGQTLGSTLMTALLGELQRGG